MGGSDDPDNLIELSIKEHAQAHFDLWKKFGFIEDKIAWECLSGRKLSEEERIILAKSGFEKFLSQENKVKQWKNNISNSLTGKVQSEESKLKRSNSLKLAYKEGRKKVIVDSDSARKKYYENNMSKLLAEGRKNSKKWKESVTSEDYKLKKTLADPRSKKVSVNGIIYNSIREASKKTNINYSKLRGILISNIDNDIFFC
jgi:tyrosyl-tRNA synthetase